MRNRASRAAFIAERLAVTDLPELGPLDLGLRLYLAHPGSGLSRLGSVPPYWAYVWAGGAALARHLRGMDLRGRRVLDFGAGSGVAGIAAALAGAKVRARERDPWGRVALGLNAGLNGVALPPARGMPRVDLVLAGDVFYGAEVAAAVLPVLEGFRNRGAEVLVGDPGRADLPRGRLAQVAEYQVRDMGDAPGVTRAAGVYRLTGG